MPVNVLLNGAFPSTCFPVASRMAWLLGRRDWGNGNARSSFEVAMLTSSVKVLRSVEEPPLLTIPCCSKSSTNSFAKRAGLLHKPFAFKKGEDLRQGFCVNSPTIGIYVRDALCEPTMLRDRSYCYPLGRIWRQHLLYKCYRLVISAVSRYVR